MYLLEHYGKCSTSKYYFFTELTLYYWQQTNFDYHLNVQLKNKSINKAHNSDCILS